MNIIDLLKNDGITAKRVALANGLDLKAWAEVGIHENLKNDEKTHGQAKAKQSTATAKSINKKPTNITTDKTAKKSSQKQSLAATDTLTAAQRDDFEERAAIMKYDGGMPRPEAERAAMEIVTGYVEKKSA